MEAYGINIKFVCLERYPSPTQSLPVEPVWLTAAISTARSALALCKINEQCDICKYSYTQKLIDLFRRCYETV